MGKIYRNKKGSGCSIYKPYKHSWAPKFKNSELADRKNADFVRREYLRCFGSHTKGIGVPK